MHQFNMLNLRVNTLFLKVHAYIFTDKQKIQVIRKNRFMEKMY